MKKKSLFNKFVCPKETKIILSFLIFSILMSQILTNGFREEIWYLLTFVLYIAGFFPKKDCLRFFRDSFVIFIASTIFLLFKMSSAASVLSDYAFLLILAGLISCYVSLLISEKRSQ